MIKRNFTLIEVLVALTVFLVGITPLIGVLTAMTEKHLEFESSNKGSAFIKYKTREISESETSWSDISTTEAEYFQNLYYELIVNKLSHSIQEIRIRVGTDSTLKSEPFDGDDDKRITNSVTYIHKHE